MKERNLASGVCSKCGKFVAPRSGWLIKDGLGITYLYHQKCLEKKNEEDKEKINKGLDHT